MEELIQSFLDLKSNDDQDVFALKESKVTSFCEANGQRFSFEHINASLRHQFIHTLISELSIEKKSSENVSLNYTARCLEALRVLSRDKSNLGKMIGEESCLIFLKLAGLYADDENPQLEVETVIAKSLVIIEALKCACNLVYQNAEFREHAIKYQCTKAVCHRLAWFGRTDLPRDVKFFDLRLLFVLTALEANERTTALHANAVELLTMALNEVVPGGEERKALLSQEHEVRESCSESSLPSRYNIMIEKTTGHPIVAAYCSNQPTLLLVCSFPHKSLTCSIFHRCNLPDISLDKDDIEVFGEILKVLFNITINISQEKPDSALQQSCNNLIFILRHMLIKCKEVLEEPKKLQNNIINMLINLPYESYNLLYWQMPKKEAKEIMKNFEADHSKNKHPIVYEVCIMQEARAVGGLWGSRVVGF
jgi:hypothetical protein